MIPEDIDRKYNAIMRQRFEVTVAKAEYAFTETAELHQLAHLHPLLRDVTLTQINALTENGMPLVIEHAGTTVTVKSIGDGNGEKLH